MAQHISYYLPELKKRLLSRGDRPEIEIKAIPSLNQKIWGIQPGKLYLLAGRTSNAKSALAINLAMDAAEQGHPTLMLSLEMDVYSLLERMLAYHQNIDNMELLTGQMNKYLNQFETFKRKTQDIELVIDDAIGKSWSEIDKHIGSLSVKPKFVIIDHVNEIKKTGMKERQVIDEYIRRFKEMAIRHNFAGMLLAQINRTSQSGDDKRPQLHQIKESGYLEESADVCMLVHYPYKLRLSKDINRVDLFVDKNRNGRTGHIRLNFNPETYRFSDYIEGQEVPQKEQGQDEWD